MTSWVSGQGTTTATRSIGALLLVGGVVACGYEGARPRSVATRAKPQPHGDVAAPPRPLQYVVSDPPWRGRTSLVRLRADGSAVGVAVDKLRVVVRRNVAAVAVETSEEPIEAALKIPERLGGGFLFYTSHIVYRADTFEGALRPLAKVRERIAAVSFAPKSLIVRAHSGERWALSLPSGARVAVEPLGVADVEALDDGRALAFTDQGKLLASTDGGAHWNDVTAQLRASPERVHVFDGELWVVDSGGAGMRLEPGGLLSWFDKAPPQKPPELRPKDPRWHGSEPPLRLAFRVGAAVDDMTALVLNAGDLFRIDTRTGEISSVVPGRLPPDAACEAVATSSDVLFVCSTRGSSSGPFVVSRTTAGEPIIEHTLPPGATFYASDDGGLAADGPCGSANAAGGASVVCVRQPGGSWQELEVGSAATDAGATSVEVARWIPRADGSVVGLVATGTPGIVDARTGAFRSIDGGEVFGSGGVRRKRPLPSYRYRGGSQVDRTWSFSAGGVLRGWLTTGGSVEVSDDGRLRRSPYNFDVLPAGAFALGRASDGRLYQTTDHGGTWTEVTAPPGRAYSAEGCTSAGCDLGGWYRVGWSPSPPEPEPERPQAKLAPEMASTPALQLACRPAGPAAVRTTTRTDASPDDLGLGDARLPTAAGSTTVDYHRQTIPVGIFSPVHDLSSSGGDTAMRAIISGYQTSFDSGALVVQGPNKNPLALRRQIAWVAPFDPLAPVRKATLAMADVANAGRVAGVPLDEILTDDMFTLERLLPVTPVDPAAPGEGILHNAAGLVAIIRGNDRVRVAVRKSNNEALVASAVAIGPDEVAVLEVEPSTGVGHVFRVGAGGVVDLFDVSPQMSDPLFYPANPDALAIGPKGDLAVVRTSSGADPASELDPALLITPTAAAVRLAPWSTAVWATDAACRADTQGYRATVQVAAPWIKVTSPELRVEPTPMMARVKWSPARVCVEAFEVRVASAHPRLKDETVELDTWLVARASAGAPSFARVGIGEGLETRQPMQCTLSR